VRAAISGDPDQPLHASDLSGAASQVAAFFQQNHFMRFGAAGSMATTHPDDIPFMRIIVETLKHRVVDVAKYSPFRSMAVIFENNERANALIEAYFGDFRLEENATPLPVDFYFMPKSANEPLLEVAGFVANAIGGHVRRNMVDGRPNFRRDFQPSFTASIRGLLASWTLKKQRWLRSGETSR
jgi:hypothetical protein